MADVRTDRAREQMIEAAERIASERGLGAMSMREVQTAANQRNKSAAQYHFGSREGLIEAVIVSRMEAIGERRAELLGWIDALGSRATVRDLVEALVFPIAEHTLAHDGSHWARFIFQCSADPTVAAVVQRCVEGSSYRDVVARLVAATDDLPEPLRARRIEHAVGIVFASLARAEGARESGRPARLPIAAQINDLIDICLAVVSQSPSPQTLAAIEQNPVIDALDAPT